MAFREKNPVQPRNQNSNGRTRLPVDDEPPKSSQRGEQIAKVHYCPQCGAVMTWWRGGPFCSRCGWREGCCD